ncbi:hypothetical protein QQF64_020194 [Cirrhinus molitorella]|uniref:Reverse transcriptase/retrotransposon-derived protein RNase H-like domain-containing protein n=1 Tax=Cirrhinus molitorella TaxID=172907 RepID=A0ABR3LBZ1_9TELE
MDILLHPHQAYAAAYLDDVVVHSEWWEDHLERLRRVLLELRRAGLTANPKKCHLALSEVPGVSGRSRPHPTPGEEGGSYPLCAATLHQDPAPLTDLTRKGQPEKTPWGPTEEEAFQRIKTALTSEPVLRAPDFNCPFLLQTDASDTGLGAVLSQVQDGEEHPVIYISRKLISAEQHYATVEKEALAVKWAVLELRPVSSTLWGFRSALEGSCPVCSALGESRSSLEGSCPVCSTLGGFRAALEGSGSARSAREGI